ncbi:MAG: hypothetical protein JWQ03_2453 [Variovorax sp.]|nr:hypothetical protein [Variovorax sp.]
MNPTAPPSKPHTNDEPEITQEDDVPIDRKDVEGERLMKEVRNDKLKDKSGTEDKTGGG